MTTTTTLPTTVALSEDHSRLVKAASDTLAITWRNLLMLRRVPELLVFSTIQPVLFVLMFRYVFGGAIRVPGVHYVDFLMPGIFAQTVTFGSINTGVVLAQDLGTGLIERFRSLPMARSAVLAGRTVADVVRNTLVVTLMVTVGFMVGFRVHTNAIAFLASVGLLLLFGFALSWVFALIGLSTANPESAQAAAFPLLAPLVFASLRRPELQHRLRAPATTRSRNVETRSSSLMLVTFFGKLTEHTGISHLNRSSSFPILQDSTGMKMRRPKTGVSS